MQFIPFQNFLYWAFVSVEVLNGTNNMLNLLNV